MKVAELYSQLTKFEEHLAVRVTYHINYTTDTSVNSYRMLLATYPNYSSISQISSETYKSLIAQFSKLDMELDGALALLDSEIAKSLTTFLHEWL